VWIENCGHMLTMEKPAEVNATLMPWLQRLAARAPRALQGLPQSPVR
jgi:hypothetical protein